MSYNNVVGGKLKIKGGIPTSSTGVTKKNKKREEKQKEEVAEKIAAHESEEIESKPSAPRNKTAAELAFEKAQKKREEGKVKKMAAVPYREKVDQLNKYLGTLSEHYDIPKVGPG